MKGWDRGLVQCAAALILAGCATTPESGAAQGASSPPPSPSLVKRDPVAREWAPIALGNPGFEDEPDPGRPCAMRWDCTVHADPDSFRFFHDETAPAHGKRSLCIEPLKREPWAAASQGLFDMAQIRGARMRFSAALRLEAVAGSGAGPFVSVQGVGGAVIARESRLLQGTQGWQRVEVEMDVASGATLVEIGVTLEGRGRVCFDDARLEIRRVGKSPV
jgi:hypothetical protein